MIKIQNEDQLWVKMPYGYKKIQSDEKRRAEPARQHEDPMVLEIRGASSVEHLVLA